MNFNRRLAMVGVLVLTAAGLFTWQSSIPVKAQGENQVGKIVTIGQAELKAAPDMATVVVGVASELRPSAGEAQSEAATYMAAVRKALATLGIPENALQTRNFHVGPEYQYDEGKQHMLGYRASHDLSVRVDQIAEVGSVLDAVVKAGVTQVRQIQFDLKDSKPLLQKALEQAVQDAQGKAKALAAGAGVKVVRVVRIQDQSSIGGPIRTDMVLQKAFSAAAESTQIAAGEITVQANVEVEFEFQ